MNPAERERAAVVAWLDSWAGVISEDADDYRLGWRMCAFNAAREIERGDHRPRGGDHLPRVSASGVPLTRRRT